MSSSMTNIVLDSSAVLAMVFGEPGGTKVRAAIVSTLNVVSISTVNWCEVLTKLDQKSPIMSAEKLTAILPGVDLVPFSRAEAEMAAAFSSVNRALSLGDRSCLALAKRKQATAWTAERLWSQCNLDVPIELIRN